MCGARIGAAAAGVPPAAEQARAQRIPLPLVLLLGQEGKGVHLEGGRPQGGIHDVVLKSVYLIHS